MVKNLKNIKFIFWPTRAHDVPVVVVPGHSVAALPSATGGVGARVLADKLFLGKFWKFDVEVDHSWGSRLGKNGNDLFSGEEAVDLELAGSRGEFVLSFSEKKKNEDELKVDKKYTFLLWEVCRVLFMNRTYIFVNIFGPQSVEATKSFSAFLHSFFV